MSGKVGLLCPFPWGSWVPVDVAWTEAYLRTKWHLGPSNRLATIHQRFTGIQDRQRSHSKMIPSGEREPLLVMVASKRGGLGRPVE